jgi:predicted glutamine amidotransferase
MCGIVAVIAKKSEYKQQAKEIFRALLIDNEARGTHSTGVLAISNGGKDFSLFKDTVPARTLLQRNKFKRVDADILIGHTRFATMGGITVRNAHPLQHKQTLLVHNGIIDNHKELTEKYDFNNYQVDSEALLPIVQNEDWEQLQELEGMANFIAWNQHTNRLYIEKHNNPLFFLNLSEMGVWACSSRQDVLDVVRDMYEPNVDVYQFLDDSMAIFNIDGSFIEQKLLKFKSRVVALAKPTVNSDYYNNYSNRDKPLMPTGKNLESDFDSWEDTGYSKGEYDGEDLICDCCGKDITAEQYQTTINDWAVPMCPRCSRLSEQYASDLQNGINTDTDCADYKMVEHVLEMWFGEAELEGLTEI